MRTRQHEERLHGREHQTRSWAAPLPDFTAFPRATTAETTGAHFHEGPRQRLEWDTRDTMNGRIWADTMDAGAKVVTSAMLESHPTAGAWPMNPTVGRQEERSYQAPTYYHHDARSDPTRGGAVERPKLPPQSLFQNAWFDGFNVEGGGQVREVRSAVKEHDYFRGEDASARVASRTFEHRWAGGPFGVSGPVVAGAGAGAGIEDQLAAAERLRPSADDYRRSYMGGPTPRDELRY
jgi:hypothetical protein